jgi:hypothetical protein
MVTRALAVAVAVAVLGLGACTTDGVHYLLRVHPTPPTAAAGINEVDVTLFRLSTSESKRFTLVPPDPFPPPPWEFDVQTDAWGSVPISAHVSVFSMFSFSQGDGSPSNGVIDVFLVDQTVFNPVDFALPPPPGPDDMAFIEGPPDLTRPIDLAQPDDLATAPDGGVSPDLADSD